jgi:riboflavin kinase/FMN adenylyltransferase
MAIGFFDGIHLGHQKVLEITRKRAAEEHGASWLLTFDPHPLKVLRPDTAPPLLTSL